MDIKREVAENTDKEQDGLSSGGDKQQQDSIDQAVEASEASFTLEPEIGLTPGPEHYNKPEDQHNYNIKQIGDEEK